MVNSEIALLTVLKSTGTGSSSGYSLSSLQKIPCS